MTESPKKKLSRLLSEQADMQRLHRCGSNADRQILDVALGIIVEPIKWAQAEVAR